MKIISPMGWGNGAYIVHKQLERHLASYQVISYHPRWTLFPFMLRPIAGTKGAELIHCVPDYAIFFYKRSIPLVLDFQNYVLDTWMRKHSSIWQKMHYLTDLRLFSHLSVNKATAMTACSHFLADLVKKEMKLSNRIEVIYNGINQNLFTPSKTKQIVKKEIRIFFSGNLTLRKGAQWLIGIAQYLNPNISIYYTGGLQPRRFKLAHPKLKPVGSVPFERMPDQYRKMDILLMPTVREGFGLSVAEAMACGLPVVASNCSAIPELVDHSKGGYLCKIGDTEDFAERINTLADSPILRRQMGQYNRNKVEEKFTLEIMAKKYKNVFDEVIRSSIE